MVIEVVREIIEESRRRAEELPEEDAEPVDSQRFVEALRGGSTSVIAEVKPSSPTKDFEEFDPAEAAKAMERGGASAISVLTEPTRFGGSMENLLDVREAVEVPVLRKDFVVDERQLHETARAGTDAVLLIARFLDDLERFVETSRDLGLEPLVEIHDGEELERALATDAEVVGVNSRDLETLEVDLSVAEKPSLACLSSRIPYGEEITEEKLEKIARAEEFLNREYGFEQLRVRMHGDDLARIEVTPDEREVVAEDMDEIAMKLKHAGFLYVTLDLQGYREGAMDEALED